MVSVSVLGAATGVGFALVVSITVVIYRYYTRNRKALLEAPSFGEKRNDKNKVLLNEGCVGMSISQQQNFSVFREQPQLTSPPAPCSPAPPHPEHVHVRLSLPDVHVSDEKVSQSQSSYSLPTMRRRSPTVTRARSMDARAVPRLSICTRSDSQQSTGNNDTRGPMSPYLRTPSPDNLSPCPEAVLRPTSPGATGRPKSLSPLSPLLSPAFSLPSDAGVSPGAASPLGAIQPDLYKKKELVFFQSGGNLEKSKCGRLHYKLKYDFDRSDLVIHVIEALDLGSLTENGFNDPYVKVTMIPEVDCKQRQTEIQRNSTDPYFDEVFKFPITHDELADRTLLLQLFDYDRFSRNDVTGEVSVPLADVDVTTEVEIWSEIIKRPKVPLDRPEILLSLSYLPSAGRLTVVVLKAANLVAQDSKEIPDSFVKVMLVYGEKKTKKKKTSNKKHCNNPVWNEALSFDVAEDDLKQCRLIINVLNCHHGNNVPVYGACVLGLTENGTGAAHWNDMLCNPRKSIAMWHALYL